MKKLIITLLTLAVMLSLSVSAMAEAEDGQPDTEETVVQLDLSDVLIQCGGFPHTAENAPRSYSMRAVSQWDAAKAALLAGLQNWDARIDLARFDIPGDKNTVSTLYFEVINDNPGLFYVDAHTTYSTTYSGTLNAITPSYSKTYTRADIATYNAKVQEIVSSVGADWTSFQKALYLHDYLTAHTRYDTSYSKRNAYSLLVDGVGVCHGYMLGYKALLNAVGIENGIVDSAALNHIWNLVKLGDSWYHVDVTWDDPTNNAMDDDPDAPDLVGNARHRYFLLSDDTMRSSHTTTDWDVAPEGAVCNDTRYEDWFGVNVTTPFIRLGDKWYYMAVNGSSYDLYATADPETDAGSVVCDLNLRWRLWNEPSFRWNSSYSGLCAWRGLLVFNTDTQICSYDPTTGDVNVLYTADIEHGYLSGFVMDGDAATCVLTTHPSEFEDWDLGELTLRPYKSVTAGSYSVCKTDGTLYLHQDAADGYLVLALYDENGKFQELVIGDAQNDELSSKLIQDGSTLKYFALDEHGVPRCQAGAYLDAA